MSSFFRLRKLFVFVHKAEIDLWGYVVNSVLSRCIPNKTNGITNSDKLVEVFLVYFFLSKICHLTCEEEERMLDESEILKKIEILLRLLMP